MFLLFFFLSIWSNSKKGSPPFFSNIVLLNLPEQDTKCQSGKGGEEKEEEDGKMRKKGGSSMHRLLLSLSHSFSFSGFQMSNCAIVNDWEGHHHHSPRKAKKKIFFFAGRGGETGRNGEEKKNLLQR